MATDLRKLFNNAASLFIKPFNTAGFFASIYTLIFVIALYLAYTSDAFLFVDRAIYDLEQSLGVNGLFLLVPGSSLLCFAFWIIGAVIARPSGISKNLNHS